MASIPAPNPISPPIPVTWWKRPKVRRRGLAAALLLCAYGGGLSYGSWTRVCAGEHCPSISRLLGPGSGQTQTSKVYAADGRLITELGAERRTVLPLTAIPLALRQAFLATEDKRFYSHHGIDYWRIFGAIKNDLLSLSWAQGFSTITMQLARNIFPEEISREKKLTRKLKEARVAVEIERAFPKDTILQLYLNQIDLDMQEAAERALQSQLDAVEAGVYSNGKFPGRTTYREYIESSKASGEDHGPFSPYLQGALVALEANTGYIRAMIGGRDFDDSKYNRATQALRQPGSTFKPFVYSAAVRAGHPVTEMVDDSPLNPPVIQLDSTLWQPKDDDDTTLGLIPMREGLYLSRNLATIKLGMALGEQTVIGEARRYGITTPLPPYPSIHIGARGVRPIEMIAAYTAFATLGTRAEPVGVLRVEDRQGNILWQPAMRREPVMDPEHTWLMVDMMKDVIRRGTAFTAVWKAGFTQVPAAGKTGTTDDYTDAWFIGYTPELVTGIWVGYDIQQRILEHNAGGGKIVAPAWTAFMRDVYDRRPAPLDWVRPDSLITREVDWSNGFLATPVCPQEVRHWDWFYPGTEPTQACPVHAPFGLGVAP